jgi:hypothetical protein
MHHSWKSFPVQLALAGACHAASVAYRVLKDDVTHTVAVGVELGTAPALLPTPGKPPCGLTHIGVP